MLAAPAAPSRRAVGLWEQVDEKSGKAESWFRITEKNGVYSGNIVKMFPKPGEDPNEKWRLRPNAKAPSSNAPVLGLALIKGMQRKGLNYENGTIMDPRDGTVYRALMKLSPDGKQLEVRGYLGIALFGRSQIWNRLPDNALDPQPATPPGAQERAASGRNQELIARRATSSAASSNAGLAVLGPERQQLAVGAPGERRDRRVAPASRARISAPSSMRTSSTRPSA